LYPFKGEEALEPIKIHEKSVYLFGRDREVADIPTDHLSCSGQHAIIQFRNVKLKHGSKEVKPYLMDLESKNGTFLNGQQIDDSRYYELRPKDKIKFATSSRTYVLIEADE